MRAFLAVQLPPSVKEGLMRAQEAVEAGAPGFYRWTKPEQMHLTLYFLGEVGEETVGEMNARLESLSVGWFRLTVGGLLLLPEPRVPRIVAAGVGGETERLLALQRRVADTVFPFAAFKEKRAFSPHVTIGRLKRGKPGNAKALKRALSGASVEASPEFEVGQIELVRSRLGPSEPRYETVRAFPLP